ncbi:MAG: hypothetical protein AAF990_25020 [Bacteroidota bacterium]
MICSLKSKKSASATFVQIPTDKLKTSFKLLLASFQSIQPKLLVLLPLLLVTAWMPLEAKPVGTDPCIVDKDPTTSHSSAPMSVFKLVQKADYEELYIQTDMEQLMAGKRTDSYQKAKIRFYDAKTNKEFTKNIKVRVRGKSRRRFCDFPPLMLKFKKRELFGNGLDSAYNKLKLVTHCLDNKKGEGYLMKEYLAYKMYNEVTDKSLKVKLLKIHYLDSENPSKEIVRYGFLIENHHEMAKRIGGKVVEQFNTPFNDFQAGVHHNMLMFQFMIGNTDFWPELMRNVKLVKLNSNGKIVVVPYDFDFSGLVDTPYAIPNRDLGEMESVRERRFVASCASSKDFEGAVELFNKRREVIIQQVEELGLLSKKQRSEVLRYLGGFYKTINDKASLQEELQKTCL